MGFLGVFYGFSRGRGFVRIWVFQRFSRGFLEVFKGISMGFLDLGVL